MFIINIKKKLYIYYVLFDYNFWNLQNIMQIFLFNLKLQIKANDKILSLYVLSRIYYMQNNEVWSSSSMGEIHEKGCLCYLAVLYEVRD